MSQNGNGRRVYTAEEKAEALTVYETEGLAEAVRATGIPKGTISVWALREDVHTVYTPEKMREAIEQASATREAARAEKRETLRDLLLDKSIDMLQRMDAEHSLWVGVKDPKKLTYDQAEAADCQRYAVSAGILIDKYRLEMGETTSRAEVSLPSRNVNSGLRDELAARRAS